MNITLIGATGYVGSHILLELLNRGHRVTAIVRQPEKITLKSSNLRLIKGDILNETDVIASTKGKDAVISAYNSGWTNPDIYTEFIAGFHSIVNSIKKAGVKRFLMVGGAGSLEVAPGIQLVDTPQFPEEWKQGALAARDALKNILEEHELEWSFITPSITMVPGQRTGKFRYGSNEPVYKSDNKSEISVEDFSVALVDELENPKHIRKRFTVGY